MACKTIIRALLASTCTLGLATPVWSQDVQTPDEATQDNVIIVTAQNREQDVNDVPIAIEVISGDELDDAGFTDLNDIDQIAPAVQVNQDQGTVKITVRGVGTSSNGETQDTSVVVNVDGEYINRPNALGVSLFDMDRVEVLRGPQGTLYGRNSTGGAINFITRKPGEEFGFNASATFGNYDTVRLDTGMDLPLGDVAAVRVAGFLDAHEGYVKHPAGGGFFAFPAFGGGRSDTNRAYGGRVSLRLDPTDALSINLAGEYAERHLRPQLFAAFDLNGAGNGPTGTSCASRPGFVEVAPAYSQVLCVPSGTDYLSRIDRGEYAAPLFGLGSVGGSSTYALRGRIAYEFSDAATLTYTGGYRSFSSGSEDGSEFATLPTIYRAFGFIDETQTHSHELRLNGTISGVVYQIGGFYFREDLQRESGFMVPSFLFGQPPTAPGTFLSYFGRDVTSESKSVFGQFEVPITDTLTAVGGLRYTDNQREALFTNASPFGAQGLDPALVAKGSARKDFNTLRYTTRQLLGSSENKITWLAGLNYAPNADTLIYAKVATGIKGGGFDSVGTFAPETNMAYSAGWKQSFGDTGQHQLNFEGYYYDYTDLQVSVLLNTAVGAQTFNAGAATIWGLEAAANFEVAENTHFRATVNYLNAQYDELFAQFNVYTIPGTGADLNGIADLDPGTPGFQQPNFAGNRPAFSPEFIITAGIEHVFELGGAGTLTARADTTFKTSYFTDFYNNNDGKQKAFTQTDLSLEFQPLDERYSVAAFVRNLENERALTYGSFVSAGPDDIFNWQFGTPRTYGVRVGVDF